MGSQRLTGCRSRRFMCADGSGVRLADHIPGGTGACGGLVVVSSVQRPRAKVFLGDVGSYSLGFVIATLGWIVWSSGAPLVLALAPALVYLADTGFTLLRRYRRGASLMEAHREHVYQRLAAQGRSHLSVALVVTGVQVLSIGLAWRVAVNPNLIGILLSCLQVLTAYLALPSLRRDPEVAACKGASACGRRCCWQHGVCRFRLCGGAEPRVRCDSAPCATFLDERPLPPRPS